MSSVRGVLDALSRSPSDAELDAVVRYFSADGASADDVAALADVLASSGERLRLDGLRTVDVASTGGPSSLSTLLAPLLLRAVGLTVATLGVPGRPAGGVDVLATIPGYRTDLAAHEALDALRAAGHVHVAAGPTWTPLDALLFAHRQRIGAQQTPALVIASVLAKKLACGVRTFGLDVRVAPWGNFGEDERQAARNAEALIDVAERLGLRAGCLLTDGRRPYQPYIGRGEALVALWRCATESTPPELEEHLDLCWRLAARTAALAGVQPPPARPAAAEVRAALAANLEAQGSRWLALERRVDEVRAQPTAIVRAPRAGRLHVDLAAVRSLLVARQPRGGPPLDRCGVTLLARAGDWVAPDRPLAAVRTAEGPPGELVDELAGAAFVVLTDDARPKACPPRWIT